MYTIVYIFPFSVSRKGVKTQRRLKMCAIAHIFPADDFARETLVGQYREVMNNPGLRPMYIFRFRVKMRRWERKQGVFPTARTAKSALDGDGNITKRSEIYTLKAETEGCKENDQVWAASLKHETRE